MPAANRLARLACVLLLTATASWAQERKPESAGPYVPTPWIIVDEVLTLAGVGPADYVVDLGSGDGRGRGVGQRAHEPDRNAADAGLRPGLLRITRGRETREIGRAHV